MEGQARDYSAVDSLEKARALCSAGKLELLYMLPLEFGGLKVPANTLYVPPGIAAIKASIDRTIQEMVNAGQVAAYEAKPEYKGNSFVPSKIIISASHPKKEGGLNPIINVW